MNMHDFYSQYRTYRHRYNLKCSVLTNIFGDYRIRIWQQKGIKDSTLIIDLEAESESEMYQQATEQLRRYFDIFG